MEHKHFTVNSGNGAGGGIEDCGRMDVCGGNGREGGLVVAVEVMNGYCTGTPFSFMGEELII